MAAVKQIRVVRHALSVLELLARSQPLGVSELARALDLDKSGVQRLLVTLGEAGWIRRSSTTPVRWETASLPRALFADHAREWLLARADPVLDQLRDDTGETAMLAVLSGTELLAIASRESPQPIRMALPYLPFAIPILGSSAGRAVLSRLTPEERSRLLPGPLPAAELDALSAARDRGWSTSSDETFPDTHSVAAPLLASSGRVFGALMVAAPAFRLEDAQLSAAGQRVREACSTLGD